MVIPSGFGQLTFGFTGSALPYGAACTTGFINLAANTPTEACDVIDGILAAEDVEKTMASGCNLTEIRVKLGPTATGPFAVKSVNYVGNAGGAGHAGVCALVRKQTGEGGRKNQGRWYWAVAPETGVDSGGVLSSTYFADVADFMGDFRASMATFDMQLYLLHGEDVVGTPTPIVGMTVQNRAATQRRRQRR